MDLIGKSHLERLKTAILRQHTVESVPLWLVENTRIGGENFNFIDHEYQERILSETAREVIIRKCSQVGISELSARMALALCNILSPYTVIYTLPTAMFAAKFASTRIDSVVQGSDLLKMNISKTTDNTGVKQFGDSFLYINGCASNNAPISTPADHLIHDELDFSDLEVVSQYQSRLKHSKWKRKTKLSTPTVPGFGIDAEFQSSRRHFQFVKCSCCNHHFIPDYWKHVKIPGFRGNLEDLNKQNLIFTKYLDAYVECPHCGGKPSLQPAFRQWVLENTEENYEAAGYQVTPFDAPNIVTVADMVKESTQYSRRQDFVNFGLGLPMEDAEASFSREELLACFVKGEMGSGFRYVMGLDMGMLCHCFIFAVAPDDALLEVHAEKILLGRVKERTAELRARFHVIATVVDSQPYTETVMSMQEHDPNMYAAVYTRSKGIETHRLRKVEEDEEEGQSIIRQVNINRDKAFDAYMLAVRSGRVGFFESEEKETIITHHQDMKRIRDYTTDNELVFTWRKSAKGDDHYHHAALYGFIASKLCGASTNLFMLPTLAMTFRINQSRQQSADDERRRGYEYGFGSRGA